MKSIILLLALFTSSSIFAEDIPKRICTKKSNGNWDCYFAKLLEKRGTIAGNNLLRTLTVRRVIMTGVESDNELCSNKAAEEILEERGSNGYNKPVRDEEDRIVTKTLVNGRIGSAAYEYHDSAQTSEFTSKAIDTQIISYDTMEDFEAAYLRLSFHVDPTVFDGQLVKPVYSKYFSGVRLSHIDCAINKIKQ